MIFSYEIMSKIYCSCCSRQLVNNYSHSGSSKRWITNHGAKSNFGNTVICRICAEDLD